MQAEAPHRARRTIERPLLTQVQSLLDAPDEGKTAPRAIVLLGSPGNGARHALLRGLAPALGTDAAAISGAWDTAARVQLCGSPHDVPADPPGPGSPARVLIVSCHDMNDLPSWLGAQGGAAPQVVTVGTLSWVELEAFLASHLGGPVELHTARTLATVTGAVPAVLSWLLPELDAVGALERVDGLWRLVENPIPELFERHVRARIASMPAEEVRAITRLALAEPVDADALSGADATVAERLRRSGITAIDHEGRLAFRSPGIASAIQRISSPSLAKDVYRASLRSGAVTPQSLAWAAREDWDVAPRTMRRAVEQAVSSRQWLTALDLADASLQYLDSQHPRLSEEAAQDTAEIHLGALEAARWLPDAARSRRHIDELHSLIARGALTDDVEERIRVTEAAITQFLDGDDEAALELLLPPADAGPRTRAVLLGHRFLHLLLAGRVVEARDAFEQARPHLRKAPRVVSTRVKIGATLLNVIEGAPHRALRQTLPLLATASVALRSEPTVVGEAQAAYVVAALNSDGPAAYPSLVRRFEAVHDDSYRADLMGFAFARAEWAYASGRIARAHQLGVIGLGSAQTDPSGLAPGIVALLAETSALLGHSHRALNLIEQFAETAPTASAALHGSAHAHIAAARCLVGAPQAAEHVAAAGSRHHEAGRLGFAAEVWYAGVRAGVQPAAQLLADLARQLDGNLHRLRTDHAHALIDDDPVAVLAVARRLETAGLRLYASEAAAWVTRHEASPDTLVRRAGALLARLGLAELLPAHRLLGDGSRQIPHSSLELTVREREILSLIDSGLSNADIARRLSISVRTVEGHITRLYRKIGSARRPPMRTTHD